MPLKEKLKHILAELKGHAPFTLLGALLGIFFMIVFKNLAKPRTEILFSIFHPAHVLLSAMVTASMFKLHTARKKIVIILLIGYFGSVGIATLSDIIIPHIGANLLGLDIPTHAQLHHNDEHQHDELCQHNNHHRKIHLGFIEKWYIVTPAALLGIAIAFFLPRTKFPHSAHILISTWASSSYLLMQTESDLTTAAITGILVTLFLAVWLPCCISDIIFPLMFVKSDLEIHAPCPLHSRHSHPHIHKEPKNEK